MNRKRYLIFSAAIVLFLLIYTEKISIYLIPKSEAVAFNIKGYNNKFIVSKNTALTKKVEKNYPAESPQTNQKKEFTKNDMYCLIQKKTPEITLTGDVKIEFNSYGPYPDGLGQYAWIYSSDCPEDKHSLVKINKEGHVEVAIDCKDATLEQLSSEEGIQWTISETVAEPGQYNFAINGPGQFLVYCPIEGFHLTRRGQFTLHEGLLGDVHGCFLWQNGDEINPKGGPVTLIDPDDQLNDDGCFKNSKQCVAMMDFKDPAVQDFKYKDSTLFSVNFEGDLKKTTRSQILTNSLEDLDNPERGLTGISKWAFIPSLEFSINCN